MRYCIGKRAAAAFTLFVLVAGSAGCARQVTRVSPESTIDLSGRWNDVDSRLAADTLISQSFAGMSGGWAHRHMQRTGGQQPTVIVGTVRNRSMEHVPVGTFVRDLERAYINSGVVRLVASRDERDEIRDERYDQQEHSTEATRTRLRQETGASHMLQGDIQSIEDRERGRSVVFYQIDLTLVNLETNEKEWVGQHKIKKYVTRPRLAL